MAGQTIETVITVDANQAIAELAKFDQETKAAEKALRDADAATKAFEKAQREAVAAVTAIDTRVEKYQRDIVALATAMASGTGNTKAYEAEMRQLNAELDRLNGRTRNTTQRTMEFAQAAADVRTQGRGSGLAMLEMSRAFEDAQYGISGVLNNIPGLLMALGVGAGLTGVVSAAAVGVSILAKRFGDVDPAAKTATDTAKKYVDDLRKEISDLSDELSELQGTATRVAMEEQGKRIEIAAKEASALIDAVGGRQHLATLEAMTKGGTQMENLQSRAQYMARDIVYRTQNPFVSPELLKQAIEAREKLDLEMAKMAAMARIEQEKEEKKATDAAIDAANERTKEEQRIRDKANEEAARAAEKNAKHVAEMEKQAEIDAWKTKVEQNKLEREEAKKLIEEKRKLAAETVRLESEAREKAEEQAQKDREKAQREREKAEEKHLSRLHDLQGNSVAERLAFDDIATERQLDNLDKLRDHEWKALKDRVEAQRDFYNEIGELATKSTELAIGLGQDYVNAKIEGAENAEAEVAAQFLKGIGNQLVGIGTKNLIEGAGMSIASGGLDPRGPALIGLGGLAIATGIAMGAGGTAIAHTAAGGQIGKPLPDRESATDRGASPRSSRGGGDGGPLVINISYGVGGPLPEDTAREIARVQRTGNRRSGA